VLPIVSGLCMEQNFSHTRIIIKPPKKHYYSNSDEMRIVSIVSSVSIACKGNLILRFIQSFGRIHDMSSVTSCLPLPKSVASPLQLGILTLGLNQTFEAMIDNRAGILTLKVSGE